MNFQEFWREKIQEPLEELQEKARLQWMALNPKERMILAVAAGIMSLLIFALVVKEANDYLFSHAQEAEANIKNVDQIERLASELLQQKNDLRRYEMLKGSRGENFKLTPFLEQQASRFGVKIAKISPTRPQVSAPATPAPAPVKPPPGKSGTKTARAPTPAPAPQQSQNNEEWVEVQMAKGALLDPLLHFLQSIDETLGVRVVSLDIKTDFTDKTKLEVTAVVANNTDL